MTVIIGTGIAACAHRTVCALVIYACLIAPVLGQDFFDAIDDALMGEERTGATDVLRSNAPPPRTIDDITQALQRYKPDPAKSEAYRTAAQATPPVTNDKQALFNFYQRRAVAATRIGLLSQRIADLHLAADFAPTPALRYWAIQQLARAEASGGNILNAIAIEEREINDRNVRGVMLKNCQLASRRIQLGDIEIAKQHLKRCEDTVRRLQRRNDEESSEHLWEMRLEGARTEVFAAEGKLAEAEGSARKALAVIERFLPTVRDLKQQGVTGNRSSLTSMRNTRDLHERRLAEILLQRGKLVEAEIASRNVLRSFLARSGLYSTTTGRALITLSRVVFEQGRFKDAALLGAAAIDSLEQSGAVPESLTLVEARKAYGSALAAQQRWNEAIIEFGKMQAGIARDALLAHKYGTGDINWAWALIKTGNATAALQILEPMLERMRQRLGERSYLTAELRGFYAVALAAKPDTARALREFAAAMPILLELFRADDASDSGGIARTLRRIQIFEAYIALLAGLPPADASSAGIDPVAESFRLADAARGSGVQRALTASAARAQISDPQLALLARQEQDGEQRIATLTDVLNRLLSAASDQQLPKVIGDMRREIESLHASRIELKREIQRRFPTYAALVDPAPATIAQARAALREGEALISIYVGSDRTYVWAIRQLGAPAFASVPQDEKDVARIVAQLRKALDVGEASIAQFPGYDVGVAHKLYSALFAPVEAGWKDATSLLIVPHGSLGQLPFSLLVTAPIQAPKDVGIRFGGYQEVPWLIRKAAITQLPSVTALITLRATPPPGNERRAFAGFGDPYFSKEQQAQADKQGIAQVAMLTRGVALRNLSIAKVALPLPEMSGGEQPSPVVRNAPVIANSSMLAQLARLPETSDEIREIAQALQADPATDVFLGVAANEKNVKTMDLSNRKVIAFATHGLVPGDLNGLEQPALALTAPEVAGIDGDGLLTMDEILGLKLNADWVVLSACNTASGDGAGAEAVSGLGRAFFYAGARALLVSNWPVETRSARLLTTDLFKRQSENPNLTRAEALRQTMLGLMDKEGQRDAAGNLQFSYAHPMFWAPFTLVGDGGR